MGTVGFLLDTHTFLWAVHEESSRLSKKVISLLNTAADPIYVSAISAYELPVNMRHAHLAGKVDWPHRDPFDRILAAQTHIDNLTLVTNDPVFQTLSWVNTFW